LELVTFLLPEAYLRGLDRLVKDGRFRTRSEAIRFAVREMIKRDLWRIKADRRKIKAVAVKLGT
jgi:Arc/MetJ-type ribon-helix-helix transcriptional regulator